LSFLPFKKQHNIISGRIEYFEERAFRHLRQAQYSTGTAIAQNLRCPDSLAHQGLVDDATALWSRESTIRALSSKQNGVFIVEYV